MNGASPSQLVSPYATVSRGPAGPALVDQFGNTLTPPQDDPAWQPPTDPSKDPQLKARAAVIVRQIPLIQTQDSWTMSAIRAALVQLNSGYFDQPAQLVDAILADDRVQATLGSRTGGLLGQKVRHGVPKKLRGSAAAKECKDAWVENWKCVAQESVMVQMLTGGHMLGFDVQQVLWDRRGPIWQQHLFPFHARYTYYQPVWRKFVAITMDGQQAITGGDGQWLLHAPFGEYRGWMRAAIRAIADKWAYRNFSYRDWARFNERHGMPMVLAKTPAAADPIQVAQFKAALQNLGQDSVVQLPQGVDEQFSYSMEMLEAKDRSWEAFPGLVDRCDMSIVLALLWQNLTTEVKEGSLAAARVHGDVRQNALESDERSLSRTIYLQLARPFAAVNFGDPDLASMTRWDITPVEDYVAKSNSLLKFAQALNEMRQAGVRIKDVAELGRQCGLDIDGEEVDPTQIEARLAAATGKVDDDTGTETVADKPVPKKKAKAPAEQDEEEDEEGEDAAA